jgi:uncharacterized damage-inducible protein DinB
MPVSRQEAIRIVSEGHRSVQELLSRLDDDAFVRRGTIGEGEWSAKDLAGHLADWEEYALLTLDEWRSRVRPWFEGVDTDPVNDEAIRRHLDEPAAGVRRRFTELHDRFRSALTDMSDEEWSEQAFYETDRPRSLGELVGAVVGGDDGLFRHADAHLGDVRDYVSTLPT